MMNTKDINDRKSIWKVSNAELQILIKVSNLKLEQDSTAIVSTKMEEQVYRNFHKVLKSNFIIKFFVCTALQHVV